MKWVITGLVSLVIALVWAIVRGMMEYQVQSGGCLSGDSDCLDWAAGQGMLVGMAAFSLVFFTAFALGAVVLLLHRLLFKRAPSQAHK